MKYKSFSNSLFCALKYNIALQGFIFTSNGFLYCCSITILIINKVVCIAMFEGFKGVLVCVVWCVVIIARLIGAGVSGVIGRVVWCGVDRLKGCG